MKFDILYPNQSMTLDQKTITYKGSELYKYGTAQKCWHCEDLTSWIDLCFEAHLCSTECEDAMWDEFRLAYNGATNGPKNI